MFGLRWKPNSQIWIFNATSARKRERWFKLFNKEFLYVRIIKAHYKAVWTDSPITVGMGDSPLQDFRTVRNASWWTYMRQIGDSKRRRLSYTQRAPGKISQWEDLLVEYMSENWQCRAKDCTYRDWMVNQNDFVKFVCGKFGLPVPATEVKPPKGEFVGTEAGKEEKTLCNTPTENWRPDVLERWGGLGIAKGF